MKVKTLVVGQLKTNCYLLYSQKSKKAAIIDPGDDADYIIKTIGDLNLKPQAILATHGHFDHVLGATELKLAFKIPFYLHQADLFLLKRAAKTAKYFTGFKAEPVVLPDKFLKDRQILKIGNLKLKIIAVPGHTEGSMAFLAEKQPAVFSGDLIFKGGYWGRTDLEGGSEKQIKASIKKILFLPRKTIIYPGHGLPTTVKDEKNNY